MLDRFHCRSRHFHPEANTPLSSCWPFNTQQSSLSKPIDDSGFFDNAPRCQDPLADLTIRCSSPAARFSEGFLPTCHPSLPLNKERHLKCTIYTDVEWLQILWPSAFLPSESFCCLSALSQFLTLLFPTSYHRLIKAKLPCSSSISFSNSQIYHLQLESCIICISPCLYHDEGDKMTTVIRMMILKDNRYLRNIHEDAFEGASGPTVLDVSSTALDTLPRRGLEHLKVLIARSTPYLKTLPPLESLLELEVAEITYTSHCCAFHTWRRKDKHLSTEAINQSDSKLSTMAKTKEDHSVDNMTDLYDINLQYPDLQLSLCPGPFQCTPESDAFNPCEDLLGYSFLRSVTWLITVFAVAGNMAVLVVLIISHQKLNVSRFLMCNLAFADLCTGVYLLLIAAMDFHSRKEYYNHATFWQTGAGCGVAGFLTVFASELSVYTLTIITLERWHTITNAMHKNKRLRLRHVVAMMAGGWAFSLLAALLPVLGVSSYTKVSICLPMDIESLASQVYVVALLLLNVTAFFIICCCYIRIYMSIHNPDLAIRHGDSKIAKRMAVLIFTDFICMAPISFFGISAALRMPLITVSHSKILLVLFYPINSLCNPFLYTIFTRSFQKDIRLLLSRCSFCLARVEFYRAQNLEAHTIPPKGSTTSPRKHHSFRFYTYHIKMQRCFLCEGGGAT
uniref:G-protein coupled receptors family 1 profile domain-containing protein n=1 Tax=Oncorhynchus tshawytscha TaxID=74940 RepID=A0AAZ3RVT1_ONCTS